MNNDNEVYFEEDWPEIPTIKKQKQQPFQDLLSIENDQARTRARLLELNAPANGVSYEAWEIADTTPPDDMPDVFVEEDDENCLNSYGSTFSSARPEADFDHKDLSSAWIQFSEDGDE